MNVLAEDLFSQLSPEAQQHKEELKVENNPVMENLVKTYTTALRGRQYSREAEDDKYYLRKAPRVASWEVELFSLVLQNLPFNQALEKYFNGVISNCYDEEITIHTAKHILDDIGSHMSGKKLTVKGPLGGNAGFAMQEATLTIHGDVGNHCAQYAMQGAFVHVHGNAGGDLGERLDGGVIHCYGHAGHDVGFMMEAGQIHLHHTFDKLSRKMTGGSVYHKGKRIVRGGKRCKQ